MRARGRDPFSLFLYLLLVGLLTACLPTTPTTTNVPSTVIASPPATVTPKPTPTPEPTRQIGDTYFPNIENPVPFTFTGQVVQGETYQKEITQSLLFCLLPDSLTDATGWWFSITGNTEDGCEYQKPSYVGIVTPPFHGTNSGLIEGWHFRNEDNTGPNDGSVNAPQETRWFQFLLSEEEYQIAWQAHSCRFWNMCDNLTPEEAMNIIWAIPKARGTLTITDLLLGNLVIGERAWIESMSFTVELLLPQGFVTE